MAFQDRNRKIGELACATLVLGALSCGEQAPAPELPPRAIRWERVSGGVPTEQRVISGIVTAVAETELAVETLVTVRDRVISAYQDILNMPI